MKQKIIRATKIEGDVIFDGKVTFQNDCVVTGCIEATIIYVMEAKE